MSRSVIYQHYTISSVPTQNTETGQWQLRISISFEQDVATESIPYWMPLEYATERKPKPIFMASPLDSGLSTAKSRAFTEDMQRTVGEVREWLNRADILVLLSEIPDRRFESYPLRQRLKCRERFLYERCLARTKVHVSVLRRAPRG